MKPQQSLARRCHHYSDPNPSIQHQSPRTKLINWRLECDFCYPNQITTLTSLNFMSILPSHNLGSSSSSSNSQSQNPNLNHGSNLSQLDALSHASNPLQSLSISDPVDLPASVPPTSESSGGSSTQVKQDNNLNGKKIPAHQKSGAPFQHHVSVQSGSQQRYRSNQGGTPASAGRKAQGINGNHLLNFHYDPISRPQERSNPPRKLPKRRPYNKDLFLQANYKFVLLDSGNHAPELIDPDKMLQWEDIVCVKYFTPHPTNCPICLEELLCPQMTSCGHIFCFSCILRYCMMGEDDHKREIYKKCPLCFMMISSKNLYTIYIENVKQHSVGDVIEFMLLTRDKDSLTLTTREKEVQDSFSKFTFSSDAELAVRKATSELDSWLARAESGLVDDMERLPYVCAAMEQLEERKTYWKEKIRKNGSVGNDVDGSVISEEPPIYIGASKSVDVNEPLFNQTADLDELNDGHGETMSSSSDDTKGVQLPSDNFTEKKIKESYEFYQAVDGQHLILHPLNMKCLLHHYGSYDMLPQRISGKILELETITQSEAMRRRFRYLSHLSLTTTFQLCEIDLSGILPHSSLSPFEDELKKRETQRKRVARKEQKEKMKAEVAAAAATNYMPSSYDAQSSYDYAPAFSLDDFEALGSSSVTSSSPPTVTDRPLFSNVTRLGFAAAHDSPTLTTNETRMSNGSPSGSQAAGGTSSFANVISRTKPVEVTKVSETVKKGKKANRVLLSTSGGRRY